MFVEASARLSVRDGVSPGTTLTQELGMVQPSAWWVYRVEASPLAGSVPAVARLGYWVVERVLDPQTGLRKTGRSAWVWKGEVQEWGAIDQTAREVAETERLEYSNVASRFSDGLLETFVLSGRWEAGGEAALYGAPERMTGDLEGARLEAVELSWDDLETVSVQGLSTLADITEFLQEELESLEAGQAFLSGD